MSILHEFFQKLPVSVNLSAGVVVVEYILSRIIWSVAHLGFACRHLGGTEYSVDFSKQCF